MKANEVAMGGTKAETDQADGPRSTAKLEHKGHSKGTKAQAGQCHGVVSGAGGHARLSGTVKKTKGPGQIGTRVGTGVGGQDRRMLVAARRVPGLGRACWERIWHADFGPRGL